MAEAKASPEETKPAPTEVDPLKVTLDGPKPPVWRRILVAHDATLIGPHRAIRLPEDLRETGGPVVASDAPSAA